MARPWYSFVPWGAAFGSRRSKSPSFSPQPNIAYDRYETFDNHRRRTEALDADEEDMTTLEAIEKQAKGTPCA